MKLFKRVWISVLERKTATLIMLLTTFLFGNVIAISLSISQSSQGVKDNLLESIGGMMTVTSAVSDPMNARNQDDEYEEMMNNHYKIYTSLKNKDVVKYADYNLRMENLHLVSDEYVLPRYDQSDDSIVNGVSNPYLIDEKEGKLSIIEGSEFNENQIKNGDNVVIVSNKVTKDGQSLKIGDEIELVLTMDVINRETMHYESIRSEPISFKVIGIFQPVENIYSEVKKFVHPFYMPNQTIVNLQVKYNEMIEDAPYEVAQKNKIWIGATTIVVNRPNQLGRIISQAETLLEFYTFEYKTTKHVVDQMVGPINLFAQVSSNVFIFALIAMTIIIGLVSFYFIRDRKHEIGIYMSLGMNKIELIGQIILETLLIGLLGIILSLGSGHIISQKYSDYLLETTIYTFNEEKDKYTVGMEMIDIDNITNEDIVSTYETKISIEDISYIIVVSLSTMILSSVFPLVYILRLDPKKVLMN